MTAPFHPRDYAPPKSFEADPDQAHWDEPQRRATGFIEETEADIRADLAEFNRICLLGLIAGLLAVAIIWILRS